MKTLVDLFEVSSSSALTSPRPLPPPPQAFVQAAPAYDGRSTLVDVDIDIDWEDTFHGSHAPASTTFRGARVWSSED